MGKKGVEEILTEIDVFIDNCKSQPFSSNNIIVPRNELEDMLNELKLKLPNEIERSKKIMRNKESILATARSRSDKIINESVAEANKLVEQNRITQLANERADEIIDSANAEADRIVEDAKAEAEEIRLAALDYTKDKVSGIRDFLAASLAADKENYKNLVEALEDQVITLEDNIADVDSSIAYITSGGVSAEAATEEYVDDKHYDDYDDDAEGDDYEEDDDRDYDDEEDDDDYDDEDFLD